MIVYWLAPTVRVTFAGLVVNTGYESMTMVKTYEAF